VWRLARAVDSSVLRQVSEADVGNSTVIVFRAIGSGSARIAFALTRGETGTKTIRAATYTVRVDETKPATRRTERGFDEHPISL
jgi:hypothetical protein